MKKEWMDFEKLRAIPKNQILIGGLVGILLLVLALPTGSVKKENKEDEQEVKIMQKEDGGNYEKHLERRLKEVLESMDGVGKAEVMITLKDNGESVVEKNITKDNKKTQEEDGSIRRTDTQEQLQEETVFTQAQSSSQEPFVSKEVTPKIEGVLVVAQGGGNKAVAKNISDAVLALFPVEAHKIKVVKMNL